MQNHNTIKTSDTVLLEKYTFHFLCVVCERELETEQNCNILLYFICRCIHKHNNTMITTRQSFLKNIPLTLFERVVYERELETEQNYNILTPTLMAISIVSFLFSRVAQPEARGPSSLLGVGFLYHILSPNSPIYKLTDFLSSPSYIRVQSPTQYLPITGHRNVSLPPSLEWYVWSSLSGNNCHAVHKSLSSGASVCGCTVGFYPSPILSAKLVHANGICTSAVFGMACLAGSEVSIQQYWPPLYWP